jgi:acyl-CoA thioesterase I
MTPRPRQHKRGTCPGEVRNAREEPITCNGESTGARPRDKHAPHINKPGTAELMKPELRIFFFGDSICFGQGVSPHKVWVSRLSAKLEETYGNRVLLTVQNPSVNGNTTRMALERMPYDVQSHSPHILYVQFGMNDCNGWETDRGHPRTAREAFASNLAEIIARGRNFGAKQVILGTNHPTTRTTATLPNVDHTYDMANRDYNAITRDVAKRHGTMLADAEMAFDAHVAASDETHADLILADQLHLSERGHDLYLQNRLPILTDAVERVINTL